jgi:hypothetical protein
MRIVNRQIERTFAAAPALVETWVLGTPSTWSPTDTTIGMALNGATCMSAVLTNQDVLQQCDNVYIAIRAANSTWVVDTGVNYGPIPVAGGPLVNTVRIDLTNIVGEAITIVVSHNGGLNILVTCGATLMA